jgi:hypothetical protein
VGFDINFQSLEQIAPITANDAKLQIDFTVNGNQPDFVQIYAVSYGETTPAGLGDIAAIIDMDPSKTAYTRKIDVPAGAIYTIWLCPRTGSRDEPDDQTDGDYWESLCVGKTITTRSSESGESGRQPPVISGVDAVPATTTKPDQITLKWTSQPYDKFLISWTQNGVAMDQGEIDSSGSSGSWTASPTVPGAKYTFSVKGGVSGGIFGNYNYSDWGPTVTVIAPPHFSSLRYFLRASGVNPGAQPLRKLTQKQSSVRKFMKL